MYPSLPNQRAQTVEGVKRFNTSVRVTSACSVQYSSITLDPSRIKRCSLSNCIDHRVKGWDVYQFGMRAFGLKPSISEMIPVRPLNVKKTHVPMVLSKPNRMLLDHETEGNIRKVVCTFKVDSTTKA